MESNLLLTKLSVISAVIQHRENHYKFGKHIHKTLELYEFISGECSMEICNTTLHCSKGDIVMIMPNTVHSFFLTTDSPCIFKHIHFEPSLFSKIFLDSYDGHTIDLITASIVENTSFFKTSNDEHLSSLVASIMENSKFFTSTARAMTNLRIAELLIQILDKSGNNSTTSKLSVTQNAFVSFTLAYIQQNFTQKILIEDISNSLNISSRYLSKIFFKQMNVTILNYINIYRINQAIDLMLNTDMTLTEISSQVGLKDSQHFSKLFRSIMGITPYKYKKMLLNTEQ